MNLKRIVQIYISECRPGSQAEIDWFRQRPSLQVAIEAAAFATDQDDKRYLHQHRLKPDNLKRANELFQANAEHIEACRDFDELHQLIEQIVRPINGLGELYAYDTAFRIGARLGLLPQRVYLHAGTRAGARKLGLDHKAEFLEMESLPVELHELYPHEIEDVLCIFKDDFDSDDPGEIVKRSRCSTPPRKKGCG